MRIKKVSQTTPVQAQIVDGYSESTTDGYSANYINQKTNIITAILTSNYTLTGTNVYGIIPLTLKSKIGDKLSMNSSGGIVIGAGVKFVKASSNVSYNSVATSGAKWNTIYKGTQALYPCPTIASDRVSISNAGGLIPVTQGDVIYLEAQGNTGDVLRGGAGNYYTCLTVEVVE